MFALIGIIISLLAYTAVGLTCNLYLALWIWSKPQAVAAMFAGQPKLKGFIEFLGTIIFFFVSLVAMSIFILGLGLLDDFFIPTSLGSL